ncbi:DUF4257 domain-containing protein [Neobacillus mesonae]|uniref:DUF4257 domain-containing protein n=1 Tax=Neobacillus mesonae TaxID=1193713 RepID=A0A3Q9QYD8_9BACI|nr:DUF4257 domain-containing protein [Neobacillus mesonae]AZU61656.1 DUF4257 domain-containing protein [Neobacillus mesonae]MED4205278.1 DUF4257 domain-containing protein [Neobacillus mesonae]
MLSNIIFSLVIGGTVGIIGHVRKHEKLIMPRKTKKFIYLGFLEEMLLGAVAALLLVLYADPNSYVESIMFSIVAGIVGDALVTGFKQIGHKNEEH